MKRSISRILRTKTYTPLLQFVNETITKENWGATLRRLDQWELSWQAGIDSEEETGRIGKIDGFAATFDRAWALRNSLRNELSRLARPPSDEARRLNGTGTRIALTWRKALVLPTGERFIEDYGERFGFLLEALEQYLLSAANREEDRQQGLRRLHLALCACGCETFFLWEGNWKRKKRKFLNDEHRMKFHNRRNVTRKRELAQHQREEGNPKYY